MSDVMQVKLALCQILSGEDKVANIATAREAVVKAAQEGAGIVALPGVWQDQQVLFASVCTPG